MRSLAEQLAALPEAERAAIIGELTEDQARDLAHDWGFWGRPDQIEPPGNWTTWLILAGRGWGKTRCGAEWIRKVACGKTPLAAGEVRRIALIAETAADARDVLVEGDSGILAVHPKAFRPMYEPSKRRLTWPNGAVATLFNAVEPDQLRGPQQEAAWCLTGDTSVLMGDGSSRRLDAIREGDMVMTRRGPRVVLASALTRRDAALYMLTSADGTTLTGTPDHPIWIDGRGWIPLGDVKNGDVVCALSTSLSVVTVERLPTRADVYDIAVDDGAEFFANGILVHNCDELAKWRYSRETWDNLQFGLRLGTNPRQVITTTPRPIPLLKEIMAEPGVAVTRGSTYDNRSNLAPKFLASIEQHYAGTRLGRQELQAEMLDDAPGALWTRANLDAHRRKRGEIPPMQRIVVAIDPAARAGGGGDADRGAKTGIVVAGIGTDGRGYVLDDVSCALGPAGWAARAVAAFDDHRADIIVAEVNQGGDMVEATVRSVRDIVPFKKVHASRGKVARAEPIAALYEQGRVSHVGSFPALEDNMVLFTPLGIEGDTTADNVDALVWALTELFPQMVHWRADDPAEKKAAGGGYRKSSYARDSDDVLTI